MTATMLYVTAGSVAEAKTVGRALVEDRLAACANVIPGMASVYWWEGAVHEDSEAVLIVKTRDDLVARAVAKIKELHSADCPCVVALPITGGNPDFLDWIEKETTQ